MKILYLGRIANIWKCFTNDKFKTTVYTIFEMITNSDYECIYKSFYYDALIFSENKNILIFKNDLKYFIVYCGSHFYNNLYKENEYFFGIRIIEGNYRDNLIKQNEKQTTNNTN